MSAVDWYDNGISETHYYDRTTKQWVKYEPVHVHYSDALLSKELLTDLFKTHHTLLIDMPSKDQISVSMKYGNYGGKLFHEPIGWLKVIEISYGEASINDEGGVEYMGTGLEYFDPDHLEETMDILMERLNQINPAVPTGKGLSLEKIKTRQKVF